MNTKFNIGDRVYYLDNGDSDINWLGTGRIEKITITEANIVFYLLTTSKHSFTDDSISSDPGVFYDYKIKRAEREIENLKQKIKLWKEEKEATAETLKKQKEDK